MNRLAVLAVILVLVVAAPASGSTAKLVVCAPGYPGSTAEAQPSLDDFSRAAAKAAGWPEGSLTAVYYPTEDAGLAAMTDADVSLALVAWPFFDEHAAKLRLVPVAQAVFKTTGAEEAWSLVAKKGRVEIAAQLAGWEIVSLAGYAPGVRPWARARGLGKDPRRDPHHRRSQVLSALRRAASGENVAVLLDGTQTGGLASLPFAADLEIVAASAKVPVAVLCGVGTRMPAARTRAFAAALVKLHETPGGAAALEGIRLERFVPAARAGSAPSAEGGQRGKVK